MKTAAFLTLGCKVNAYETNGMERLFEEKGYKIVPFSEKADVYVINTCTVTNMADRKSRKLIHRARKENPNAVVVAAGCYVQASIEPDTWEDSSGSLSSEISVHEDSSSDSIREDLKLVDLLIGNNKKALIAEIVEEYRKHLKEENGCEEDQVYVEEMKMVQEFEEIRIERAGDKTRAYIKIQDGCNQFCSYCIIPYVRGRIRSRQEKEILNEIRSLVQKGYKEVVLTGIHLASYGADLEVEKDSIKNGALLLSLIHKISESSEIERIRLGSLEPRIITDEFLQTLSKEKKLCPHFHLSLQSGCDETLMRMNRHYTANEYLGKCQMLREYFDEPAITTDIITGFPMETEEEFQTTLEFISKAAFSDVHIFKYSRRKGTKAAKMEGQIEEWQKQIRSEKLIEAGQKQSNAYREKFLGTTQTVLLEDKIHVNGNVYWTGHTKRYIKVLIPFQNLEVLSSNQMVTCTFRQVLNKGEILADIVFTN